MPCECERSGNIDADREHVFLRFIGGKDKVGKYRGRWRTYETGIIYRTLPEYANFEAYPYWEPATEEEFCAQEKAFIEAGEESVDSTASDQDDVTVSAELPEEKPEDDEPPLEPSDGLHIEFGGGITEAELITGMDTATLKNYVVANGGKVDGRWGKKRLIQEALKL